MSLRMTAKFVGAVLAGVTLEPWYREATWSIEPITMASPTDKHSPAIARFRIEYNEPDVESGEVERQHARWWYVEESASMESVVKTAWLALSVSDEHRRREAFKVNGVRLFDPHKPLMSTNRVHAAYAGQGEPADLSVSEGVFRSLEMEPAVV